MYLAATYPSSTLSDAINSQRLRILVPLLLLALILIAGAVFAADRISRALTELAGRAAGLSRGRPAGDELSQLGSAIDEISTELTTRMGELEAERGRFKETLQRYGETLAATHDLDALVGAVLDTAVQATRARGGRLLLYDAERGEAVEQARIGTARGSRSDLPVVVAAGDGLEGDALASHEPRVAQTPRAVLAVPILREHHLLGLVTAVDPEEGAFSDDDVESLSALAVQAGVAIENARLHRVVERQAVTDALTGLANRRQFYEVLGREYERAQRFGQPVSLILLDIDDFKQINDSRGHLAGDAVLHSVAATRGRGHPRDRPGGPLRRRGVRGALASDRPGGRGPSGRAAAQRDRREVDPVRHRGDLRCHRQLRRRGRARRANDPDRSDRIGRCRALSGQARGQESRHRVGRLVGGSGGVSDTVAHNLVHSLGRGGGGGE